MTGLLFTHVALLVVELGILIAAAVWAVRAPVGRWRERRRIRARLYRLCPPVRRAA